MSVIEESISCLSAKVEVDITTSSIVGVNIPELEIKRTGAFDAYDLITTPAMLDVVINDFDRVLPLMFKLAQLETSLKLLANEIEKTRRRVNALEYVLIPQLEDAARFITMKLDEMERSNFVRLMKIKSIVS
jgi:V/A-type H+-transporting ATPase subunit D